MEVDILNDILSRTVSNLFSDKLKHMSYVSEDDISEKSELSLEEAIASAVQNNYGLQATQESENTAKASLEKAKGESGFTVSLSDRIDFSKKEGNDIYHNCNICKDDFISINESLAIPNNCYLKCNYNYYFTHTHQYFCTESNTCPEQFNILK